MQGNLLYYSYKIYHMAMGQGFKTVPVFYLCRTIPRTFHQRCSIKKIKPGMKRLYGVQLTGKFTCLIISLGEKM